MSRFDKWKIKEVNKNHEIRGDSPVITAKYKKKYIIIEVIQFKYSYKYNYFYFYKIKASVGLA